MNELTISNDSITDPAELKRLIEEDGYLFFRGLLDADGRMSARKDCSQKQCTEAKRVLEEIGEPISDS